MKQTMTRAVVLVLAMAGAVAVPVQAQATDHRPSARYAEILREDPTAAVDSHGQLYYTEPVPEHPHAARGAARAATPEFPLDQTFDLHSKPGSQRTILLDFDGGTVSDTAWNDDGLPNGSHPGWDPAGNGASFNNTERALVQEIWQWVAEDYAPFDVDVTTKDPGAAAILRSNSSDQVFGTRALITPDDAAVSGTCGECVGVAYLDVFDQVGGHSQPVWVFPQAYGTNAKGIAETISHEVGHNLNLEHDSDADDEYAPGHDSWAPIMGNSDNEPISQWSKGDYPGATNHQDDFAAITGADLSLRSDEGGDSVGAASTLPSGTAYITSRTDKDFYDLGECSGTVQVAAVGSHDGTDLDIELRLYSSGGSQVAIANPVSAKVRTNVASGMSATISTSVTSGSYVVGVDGVGRGNWTTGYDDYASVGAYTLTVSGCDGSGGGGDGTTPSAPTGLTAVAGAEGTSAEIAWLPPTDSGESPVNGYEVTVGGVTDTVSASTLSYTATDLTPGQTYAVSVAAMNDAGTGAAATTSVTMPSDSGLPGIPAILGATSGRPGGQVTASVRWAAPDSDGGSPLTGYRIKATRWSPSGRVLTTGTTSPIAADRFSSVLGLRPAGIWSFQVQARNAFGWGPLSLPSKKVRGR